MLAVVQAPARARSFNDGRRSWWCRLGFLLIFFELVRQREVDTDRAADIVLEDFAQCFIQRLAQLGLQNIAREIIGNSNQKRRTNQTLRLGERYRRHGNAP